MASDYPVGKAQRQVLDALGQQAYSFQQAEQVFADLGIVVTSKRQGRSSVPVVKLPRGGYRQSEAGDYEYTGTATTLTAAQFAAIQQWLA